MGIWRVSPLKIPMKGRYRALRYLKGLDHPMQMIMLGQAFRE